MTPQSSRGRGTVPRSSREQSQGGGSGQTPRASGVGVGVAQGTMPRAFGGRGRRA
ncbi:hypothetical protein KY285_000856 [Solanum tuberosum]|nr:hypothetical protein KY285_000856 [Solanum tuberosum]